MDFYIRDESVVIPSINFFHETGHIIDDATNGAFSKYLLTGKNAPDWVDNEGFVDRTLLGDKFRQPVQARPAGEPNMPGEFWADSFGNYMAGNINLSDPINMGRAQEMSSFVSMSLEPYAHPYIPYQPLYR